MTAVAQLLLFLAPLILALKQEHFADPVRPGYSKDVVTFFMRLRPPSRFHMDPANAMAFALDRSSSISIENLSKKVFHLTTTQCSSGGYSTAPPHELAANGTVTFAIASDTILQSVACVTEYRTDDGESYIYMNVDNPVVGSNMANATTSADLDVITTVGPGMNNNVRFIVKPK